MMFERTILYSLYYPYSIYFRMAVGLYKCMHACMHACINIHTQICLYIHIYGPSELEATGSLYPYLNGPGLVFGVRYCNTAPCIRFPLFGNCKLGQLPNTIPY